MTHTGPIPCPLDLARVADVAIVDALGAAGLGALVRVVAFAWAQEPACTLPDDDSFLAAVARITDEEWAALRPRLLLALGATQTPPPATAGGNTGRLTLGHARRVYDAAADHAARTTADRRAAGRAGARARWGGGSGPPMAGAIETVAPATKTMARAIAAPALRSESSALSLPRSNRAQNSDPERSGGDVIAQVGAGARAILAERVAAWRRDQSLRMLQRAIGRWREAGTATFPIQRASELAGGIHACPARVESLIEAADSLVAGGKCRRGPVAVLIHGLDAGQEPHGKPAEISLFAAEKWARLEASACRMMEAQAAILARQNRAATIAGEEGSRANA